MPKVNVYVPDDLLASVRAAGVKVSALCQEALETEVRQIELRAMVAEGLDAVALRLLAGQKRLDRQAEEKGFVFGAQWARETASLRELERIDRAWDRDRTLQLHLVPTLMTAFLDQTPDADLDPDDWLDGESSRFDRGVISGASKVYREVLPLLTGTAARRRERGD